MSIEFLLTSVVLALLPGPGVLYVLSVGITQGARAAVVGAVGCVLGAAPYLAAAAAGLDAVVAGHPIAFEVLKWAGVAYLVFLGVRTWRARRQYEVAPDTPPRSVTALLGYGALLSLLNPKLPLFFFAFLPRYLAPDRSDVVVLSITFLVLVGLVYSGYGVLAAVVRQRLLGGERRAAWTRRVFAGCYGLLAARLALHTV
ncbi:LysE family translocator [Naasia sp. SYSU D00057]|uniref:LysE family translocator n=1 Tax=Naasia sp. SYSU D00057 TaxID=2817380 RepID=UPI001B303D07|nr:LysE family translocator [Naasia sp. SYSU D00057]